MALSSLQEKCQLASRICRDHNLATGDDDWDSEREEDDLDLESQGHLFASVLLVVAGLRPACFERGYWEGGDCVGLFQSIVERFPDINLQGVQDKLLCHRRPHVF
jgi:hypothetical protein